MLERLYIARDDTGAITDVVFNRSASLGVGKDQQKTASATSFSGNHAFGNPLLGSVAGSYDDADFGKMTPNCPSTRVAVIDDSSTCKFVSPAIDVCPLHLR